jgi:oxygen-dependent protoporphyrinogen oxidase
MEKKRVLILGAGISGLSLAYFLSRYSDLFEITILEKKARLGGWIASDVSTGFFFENGPRTFRYSKSQEILSLVQELGIEHEMIRSPQRVLKRYLWIDGKLRKAPLLSWPLISSLLKEWRVPRLEQEDESVYDFACRRFNPTVAQHLFDPLVIGIYAGDMKVCSMRSCFPNLKEWEERWGSVTRGYFSHPDKRKKGLITLRGGVETIVRALKAKIHATYIQNGEVTSLRFTENKGIVNEQYEADYVFSALPAQVIGKLLIPELLELELKGTTVVNLGYSQEVLKQKGFGYIVSSKENDEVFGVVFNSNVFPEQNRHSHETRLTVKLRRTNLSDADALEIALKALKKHLGIHTPPTVAKVITAENAFPIMKVGHTAKMQKLEQQMEQRYPRLRLVGNYLYGVSVDNCIGRSRIVAEKFAQQLSTETSPKSLSLI